MTTEAGLPKGWCWSTLTEVCEKIQDGTHFSPQNQLPEGKYRYVTAKNVRPGGLDLSDVTYLTDEDHREIYQRCDTRRGDVLLVKDGVNTGDAAINTVDDEISLLSSVCMLRPRDGALQNQFLRYYLLSPIGASFLTGKMTGTAIRRIILKRIKETPIPLAPLGEQARIVATVEELLSDLDAGISALARARANLKKYRAAVLKAAVTGELTADWRAAHPNVEPATKLLDRILAERRRKWEAVQQAKCATSGKPLPKNWQEKYAVPEMPDETALIALPPGWVWAAALQICERVESGSTPSAEKMHSGTGDIPFIKVYNLTANGRLNFNHKSTFISKGTHQGQLARSRVLPGDVLMNIVGPPLGKVSLVPEDYPEWNMNQAVVLFRPSPGLLNRYLMLCLLSDDVLTWITRQAKATAGQFNISVSMSRELPIPLPSTAEQEVIVEETERQLSVISAAEDYIAASLKRAVRLRQSILNEAFAGRLVPQDPTDEPASVLLARIRESAARAGTIPGPRASRARMARRSDEQAEDDDGGGAA